MGRFAETPTHCLKCKEAFSAKNVFTDAGWREISISGWCERCFDEAFAEEETPGADEEME